MSTRHHLVGHDADRNAVFVTVRWDGKRLSISGVVGPKSNGDARGSCGQCIDAVRQCKPTAEFAPFRDRLVEVWERWHLNDMRADCEHQRALWDTDEPLEVVTYHLTTEANMRRRKVLENVAHNALRGNLPELSPRDRALAEMADWFRDRYSPPDADSPLSDCFEVRKRETRPAGAVGWNEHPRGLLSRECPTCGYRYGTKWLTEDVPAEVIDFLASLPTSDALPTCWQR